MNQTLRLVLGSLIFIGLSACSVSGISASNTDGAPVLTVLDSFHIPREKFDGDLITELSDLAWDEDEQLLYAVSDRGKLFHFKLTIENERIIKVEPVFARTLRNAKDKKLDWRDSEGLFALKANNGKKGDTQLAVSLEGIPRLLRMNTRGTQIGEEKLNKALRDRHQFRESNTGLESVAYHPKYGFITAPERSLKGQPDNLHTLYSAKQQWSFMAYPSKNSSITALEVLPDQSLLVLERAWAGFPNPLVISVRRVDLSACSKEGACVAQDLMVSSSLLSIDNYEGLTHIRDNLYLMVSDDGNHDLLRTTLTLFKVE